MADAIPFLSRTPITGVVPALSFICIVFAVGLLARSTRSRRKLPPGPPGEPFIGNTRQIPPAYSWLSYTELAEKYGEFQP
jgi:hypothetical protein